MTPLRETLIKLIESAPCWTEVRYHRRENQVLQVQSGLLKQAKSSLNEGVGIRVFVEGTWGFSSTSDLSPASLERALKTAIECGRSLSQLKTIGLKTLPSVALATGEFKIDGYDQLKAMPLPQKLERVIKTEEQARKSSQQIQSANCMYNEIFEDKIVITTDGANAASQLARNEFRVSAIASQGGNQCEGHQNVGKTGEWNCLFEPLSAERMTEEAARTAIELLKAPQAPGGLATLILSPAMVGILAHEAIGHTVEADFVLSGSVAQGKLGQKVASPLVTLCDSGTLVAETHAGGALLVDDEGVLTQKTVIIRNGILSSYLHNRESAALFNVQPTGNARAWLYHDEPLIRMRNTYIEPGSQSLEEIIASTPDGYLVDLPLGGQADATGEFMFGAQRITKIENGKLGKVYRGATISGRAFEVLSTVDAVSKEFRLDLGSGYCGKGQPAKVDAGGPYIRCKATIGGVQ